ncbi:MAG: phage portal protein, partial [Lachnospiraceae bacterium]
MGKKENTKIGVRLIGGNDQTSKSIIQKSDRMEHVYNEAAVNAAEWISHPVDMRGLRSIVDDSTILPQCINAYGSNIAGFGIGIRYKEEQKEETAEMKAEWNQLQEILHTLNMDKDLKEVFEDIIKARETFGISYVEIVRDMEGNVVQMEHIVETDSIDMTYPLEPYQESEYWCGG